MTLLKCAIIEFLKNNIFDAAVEIVYLSHLKILPYEAILPVYFLYRRSCLL